jgi:hypothetical protein
MLVLTEKVLILMDEVPDEELSNQSWDEQQDSQEVCWSGCQSHPILCYDNQFVVDISRDDLSVAFLSWKEEADLELLLKLCKKGVIITSGALFEASQQQEIDGLIAWGVFEFVSYNQSKYTGECIFWSRLVNEIKGKATTTLFEKSRLVIQAYNDEDKEMILTQSPTIQQVS